MKYLLPFIFAFSVFAQSENESRIRLNALTAGQFQFLAIPISSHYSVSAQDVASIRYTNMVFAVDTTAGNINFQLPSSFPNVFSVINMGTNRVNIIPFSGQTIAIAPASGAIAYANGLTNAFALKVHTLFQLNETNVVVQSEFRPLPNIVSIVTNNITFGTGSGTNGLDGTNGLNGTSGTNGLDGINGINGTNGLNGTSGTNGLNGTSGTNGLGFNSVVKLSADLNAYGGTSLTNAGALAFTVTNGGTYHFRFAIAYQSTNTTTGLTLALNGPTFTMLSARSDIPIAADGTAAIRVGWHTNWADSNIGTATPQSNVIHMATMEGVLIPSADGTLQLRFASEVSSSAVWIKRGSSGTLNALP